MDEINQRVCLILARPALSTTIPGTPSVVESTKIPSTISAALKDSMKRLNYGRVQCRTLKRMTVDEVSDIHRPIYVDINLLLILH